MQTPFLQDSIRMWDIPFFFISISMGIYYEPGTVLLGWVWRIWRIRYNPWTFNYHLGSKAGCSSQSPREKQNPLEAYLIKRDLFSRIGSHNCGAWQAQNLQSRLAGWRWGKERCSCFHLKAVWRWKSPFLRGPQSFSLKAFTWLNKAHPHYGGSSAIPKDCWFKS